MEKSPSQHIDDHVKKLTDWRGPLFKKLRAIVKKAVPDVEETWKWRGVPVWERDGIITTGETYPKYLKMTFAKGASLKDPAKLFNASLEGNMRRAIDFHEGVAINEKALVQLIRDAVALNQSKPAKKQSTAKKPTAKKPVLLSGGNPQVARGDGDAPVTEYISKLTGWKHELVKRIDARIGKSVPGVKKAVKWNSPFYGSPSGDGFFLGLHVMTKYVKLAFFRGADLTPIPPGESKTEGTRYLDLYEDDEIDDKMIASWIKQAAALPGWSPGSK